MKKVGDVEIRPLVEGDWPTVRAIYLEGIATGQATFETTAPSWEKWDNGHLPFARLVATSEDGRVAGWAAISSGSARAVYRGVAEVSVYVGNEFTGRGIGRALLEQLVIASEENGIWTLQASVFPENQASMALHKRSGFREVGTRRRIGKMGEVWRDTVLLERRSQVVGTD
ncbi:MAG: N-acetyltransferase family protein [Acidobacteriota bacterium]|nr:N-acetyltransferase family protein [Acidobacteriota bacterium]